MSRLHLIIVSAVLLLGLGGIFGAPVAWAQDVSTNLGDVGTGTGLADTDLRLVLGSLIQTALSLLGILALLIVLYAGFIWMTAGGDEEKIARAKKILINGTIGLVIILASYAITTFIVNAAQQAVGGNGTSTGGAGTSTGGTGFGAAGRVGSGRSAGTELGGTAANASDFTVTAIRPSGSLPIRNVQVSITLSRAVDVTTAANAVTVTNTVTNVAVPGSVKAVGNRLTFAPSAACPAPNATRQCFDAASNFRVEISPILKSSTGTTLSCANGSCAGNFSTGDVVDVEDPVADLNLPTSGERIVIGDSIPLNADGSDDVGVVNAEFSINDVMIDAVPVEGADIKDANFLSTWETGGLEDGARYNTAVTVYDAAGNSDSSDISVRSVSGSCLNGRLDGTETAVDCGGECGACAGTACTQDSECASSTCQGGTCSSDPQGTGTRPTAEPPTSGTSGTSTGGTGTSSSGTGSSGTSGTGTGETSGTTQGTTPFIASVTPADAGIGGYITITGSRFGTRLGSVYFENVESGERALADTDFPDACDANIWSDTEIKVKVPARYLNNNPLARAPHKITVTSADSRVSNAVNFSVNSSNPAPGICAITPNSGEANDTVTLIGEHFGGTAGQVAFYNEAAALSSRWSAGEVVVTVPAGAKSGPVELTDKDGAKSNRVNFTIGSQAPAASAGGSLSAAGYGWSFSTGKLARVPALLVECSDNVISAVPNNQFTSGGVCVNAQVFGEFTQLMDESTFQDGQSVKIEKCTDFSCSSVQTASGSILVSQGASSSSFSWRPSSGNFDPSTTYRVTITKDLKSVDGAVLDKQYQWLFTTAAATESCTIEAVRVSPKNENMTAFDQTGEFNALPVTGCVVLNADAFAWSWEVDPGVAAITEGDCADSTSDSCAVVRALSEGVTPVTATEDTSTTAGSGELTVDFTDPYVTNVFPSCSEACVNALVGLTFNLPMEPASVEAPNAITLDECNNELCTAKVRAQVTASCIDESCTTVGLDTQLLKPATYYRVIVSGTIRSASGVLLTRTNFGGDYSWTFATKDDATLCSVSNLDINPKDVTVSTVGAMQSYVVTASGDPDSCSVSGQRLAGYRYNYSWENPILGALGIAEWWQPNGSLIDTDPYSLSKACTSECLPRGSIGFTAVCGDGRLGMGEDCDDGNSMAGDGCSSICLREGGAGGYGTCGNGSLEQSAQAAGEDCDDANLVDGDGCSAQCLNEGSKEVSAVCGNGSVGYDPTKGGEDCDDGNRVSGDGCSSLCLNEGTPSATTVGAICGDRTVQSPWETCDDGNQVEGDGCSKSCLREGAQGSIGLCGNNIVDRDPVTGAGEDCDAASDSGCSRSCLRLGSSLEFDSPSVCGDGFIGTGEDAVCEVRTSDSRIDPLQIATISQTAGDHVDLETRRAVSTIKVAVDSVSTSTTLSLSCVADQDADCPAEYGVGTGGCCLKRPTGTVYPAGASSCRNAALYGIFDAPMNPETFKDNVKVILTSAITTAGCPATYQFNATGECLLPLTDFIETPGALNTSRVTFRYAVALEPNAQYRVVVKGDTLYDDVFEGVKSMANVPMNGDLSGTFSTGADLCQLSAIETQDNNVKQPFFFSLANEQHEFVGRTYSYAGGRKQEIEPLPGIYAWTWNAWQEDSQKTVFDFTAQSAGTASVKAVGEDGRANLGASATITESVVGDAGKTVRDQSRVLAMLCANPWPAAQAGLPFTDPELNFSTYFCRDGGAEGLSGDLPTLTAIVSPTSPTPGTSEVIKEFFLKVGDDSSDAIGMRVLRNERYLNPLAWYQAHGFMGNSSATTIDGLQALRDGRTVYIAAPNLVGANIFPNIYVISYNQGASENTVSIFEQLIAHLDLITNVEDTALCLVNGVPNNTICTNDSDCAAETFNANETRICGDKSAQLTRDLKRLGDLEDVSIKLAKFGGENGLCSATTTQSCKENNDCPVNESCNRSTPRLQSGTFVRALSSSIWSSWGGTLGGALDTDLPVDPLNDYVDCGAGELASFDKDTCVDSTKGEYVCPAGSYVYHYQSVGPFGYRLSAELEYTEANWAFPIDSNPSDQITMVIGGNTSAFPGGFTGGAAYCDGARYGSSSTCGDGLVGEGEVCEIGQRGTGAACDSNGDFMVDGTFPTICNDSCSGFTTVPNGSCVPTSCGNGAREGSEQCDDGSRNGQYGACGFDCTYASAVTCGDGTLSGSEICDCGLNVVGGRNSGGTACTVINGAYTSDPRQSCGWDCRGPSTYCGNGIVEASSGELCDGNTESYAGKLCRGGIAGTISRITPTSGAKCSSNTDCSNGEVCGSNGSSSYSWADACPTASVCVAGDAAKLGTVCTTDVSCGEGGDCSTQTYPTSRTRVCQDDGEAGQVCNWSVSSYRKVACTALASCGNGTLEGTEQCDDGNRVGTDSCTNACATNVCGDGYVNEGVEQCDNGTSQNGQPCSSTYGSSCSYCSASCRLAVGSGSFCGDGVKNGGEYCDGSDVPYAYIGSDGTLLPASCSALGSTTGSSPLYTCSQLGVCDGGTRAGTYCASGATCLGGGQCVIASCAADCHSSCPDSYAATGLLMKTNQVGATRLAAIELESSSAVASGRVVTADAATLYLPACTVAKPQLTFDLSDRNREYPNVDIMFVLDKSVSMNTALGSSTRLAVLRQGVTSAVTRLFDTYSGLSGAQLRAGLTFIGGTHGAGATYTRIPDTYGNLLTQPLVNSKSTVLGKINSDFASVSGTIGTPIHESIIDALTQLRGSTADVKYLVIFTDGDIWNGDYTKMKLSDMGKFDVDGNGTLDGLGIRDANGNGKVDESEYMSAVTALTTLAETQMGVKIFTAIFSANGCDRNQMSNWSSMSCSNSRTNNCVGAQAEGNVSCTVPSDDVTYAYSASNAAELTAMYDAITSAILDVKMTVTYNGQSVSQPMPTGNNKVLTLPSNFACNGAEQTATVRLSYPGGGTVGLADVTTNACTP